MISNDNGSFHWNDETYSNELLLDFPPVDYDIDTDNWWYERADYYVETIGNERNILAMFQ